MRDPEISVELVNMTPPMIVTFRTVDGVPYCRCCDAPMLEFEPRRWQCQLGATLGGMLGEALDRLTGEQP